MILAVWGFSYVWSCLLFLSAPGHKFTLPYKSPGGVLTLTGESYSVDLDHGVVSLNGLRLLDPKNLELAAVDQVKVLGLSYPLKTVTVRGNRATGRVRRLETGRLDFQDYLPQRQGPPANIPFAVNLNSAGLLVEDLTVKNVPFTRRLEFGPIDVRGIGDRWLASSNVDISNTGSADVSVQSLPKQGFLVRANSLGLRLDEVFEHLKRTPEGKNWGTFADIKFDNLTARGPASLFIPANSAFTFEVQLNATARNIAYGQYRADNATFKGRINETGASGFAVGRRGALHADFNGSIIWGENYRLAGQLSAIAPSKSAIPSYLSKFIPANINFTNGKLKGWLSNSKTGGFGIDSRMIASSATAYGQTFGQPDLDIYLDADAVRLGVNKATWSGTPVVGAAKIGLKDQSLVGEFSAAQANLTTLAANFGARGLTGTAKTSILLGGTTSKPVVLLQADGKASYPVNGQRISGDFRTAANFENDVLDIQRATLRSDLGFLRAIGKVYLKGSRLALKVEANGLQLAKLRDDLEGNVTASGVLDGTFKDPRFNGKAVALGVKVAGQEIPFASTAINANRTRLLATNLRVVKGSGEATGSAALAFKNSAISGDLSVRNLLLNEYFGEDALGVVNIPNLALGGTLSHPTAAGDATGENLLLAGIQIDAAQIKSSLDGNIARVDSATLKVGEGTLTADGSYNYKSSIGKFAISGSNLSLAKITPPGKGAANISGILDGNANIDIRPNSVVLATSAGTLRDVAVNKTEFGSGNWKLAFDGTAVQGEASVGKLDRFFLLENLNYDTNSHLLAAQLSVLNGAIGDLYTAAKPFFPQMDSQTADLLQNTAGNLDTTVALSGDVGNPNIDVKVLEARDLSLKDQSLGVLKATGRKEGENWFVEMLRWTGPQGDLFLAKPAQIDLNGDLLVDAELKRFDLSYLSIFSPSLANVKGQADISLLATGNSKAPSIHATASSSENSAFAFENSGESFRILLDSIQVDESQLLANNDYSGGIVARGKFYYRGLTGDVSAKLPFKYPFEIPEGPAITADVVFPEVDLKEIAKYAAGLDTERSEGSVSGTISLVGPLSNLALSGQIKGNAPVLAISGLQTTLQQTVASVELKGNTIALAFQANGSNGGDVVASLTAVVPDLRTTIDQVLKEGTGDLQRIPVAGTVKTNNFAVREAMAKKENGNYRADVTADLKIEGPAKEPLIAGKIDVANTNVLLPSVFQEGGPSAELLFNPTFQVPITLIGTSNFTSSLANVNLTGDGMLAGSLARPDFSANLNVEGGQLRLPTARVQLDEGGSIRPSYSVDSTGQTVTRVDVNLQGHTSVTANKVGESITRYSINLDINGDLLKDGGLVLKATSDPPDLSQDEILGLLGQTDILKSFESGSSQSETERRIREALISVAIPQLTEGFTSQIAKGLGLDYLSIEYNAFEGASAAFAKSIGKGLILEGRRQLSPQIGDRKVQYDLRLNYRIPTRNRTLSRLVFSIGLDQDRPYKLGLQYGFRF